MTKAKGVEPYKVGTKVKTDSGEEGEIGHIQQSNDPKYPHSYKVTAKDNDEYRQKRLENGNFIPHNRLTPISEPVKKKTKGDWKTVPSKDASFNNGKVRVKKSIVENAIAKISLSLSEDYKSEKRKKDREDRKKWDAEHDAWQKKQEQERAAQPRENHIGKSFSIKSGQGYWDITNYPIGGNFKRAGAGGVIAKVDSHLPDHIASHHQVNVTGKTKEGRTIAFHTKNADSVNE